MKILILEIGRRENKNKYSGFSLLEIIVVISIISILGIIIGLSTNFINSSNECFNRHCSEKITTEVPQA